VTKVSEVLISGHGLCYEVSGRRLLDNVDLTIRRQEVITVIGPNGAGKTTLIRVLLGLLQPSSGVVERMDHMSIGYVPQRLQVNPLLPMTVARFMRTACRASAEEIQVVLNDVGLGEIADRSLQKLSGGEWQRTLLARALLRKPDLLVLDEPLQGVDVAGQAELYRLITDLRDRYNCGVLMVSHDLHLVMEASDSVLCLNQHVCCSGRPEAITQHPEYLRLIGDTDAAGLAVYSHHHDHVHDAHGDVHELHEEERGHG
jgi:zinc transport system ATP-binding protein